ncbi:helix-turn-helix domain-containing protein [Bacillus pseudomycoides]|uniref:Helix-turn-helix domain-containing protein n=2 Tax=Bacillus bingmayongensis TaxID=1150157 RepID=A0ABU5K286_9BACI|nr:helix-turn-helix domain-containing protein [Bacillus pseudomycoides]
MKQFGNIPEGYLTGKDVAFEESQKVALKGKVKKWLIPKQSVDEIELRLKYISENYYTIKQLADKLGVIDVRVKRLIDDGSIEVEEITIVKFTSTYILTEQPKVKELLSQKESIDKKVFISRAAAAAEFGATVAVISYDERRLLDTEKFSYFNVIYLNKEAIRRVLGQKNVKDGYMTIKDAADKLELSTTTLAIYCSNGTIKNALKTKGSWIIPCDYVEDVLKKRREQSEKSQKYMTLVDFCEKVGHSWKVVKTRIKNGNLPDFIQMGNKWFIPVGEVSKYIDNTDWLQRKAPPKTRSDEYYSKDSMLKEFEERISEIASPHLPELTDLYMQYFKEYMGKTRQEGYKLKSLTTDYVNVYQKIILLISTDIGKGIEDTIEAALLKTTAAHRLQVVFSAFLNFAFGMKDIVPKKEFKVSRNEDDGDEEFEVAPYSPDVYQDINLYARELEEHIPRALRSASYANMWVYVLLHLTDVWRHKDIVEKLPEINLEQIGVTQHAWFKENRLTLEQCQKIINELRVKLRPEVTNKTRAYLTFLVEPTLVECVGHALVISEIHRRKKDDDILLYTFLVRNNVATVGKQHRKFFDRKPELKEFRNRKMNRSTMTYLHYHIVEEDADNADMALNLAKQARSHEREDSTSIYVKLMNKDGSVNRVASNLFKRGHFGWLYNYIILSALEGTGVVHSLEERTRAIEGFREDVAPRGLEDWAQLMHENALKRQQLILQLSKMPKEELLGLIRKIFNQQMPAKTSPGQCMVYSNCKYPSRKNCFGCEYFIPQFYVLIEAATEFKRVVKSMVEARYETTFIRDKQLFMTIMTIFKEANQIYSPEQVSGFLPKKEIKEAISSIQAKTFIE